MYHGGVKKTDKFKQIMRFASLLFPLALTIYGLFIQNGYVQSFHYSNDLIFFSLMIVWALAAAFAFLSDQNDQRIIAITIGLFHIFAICYLLLVSGFANPFSVGWVLLFIASYLRFGQNGLQLSIVTLVATAGADAILHPGMTNLILNDALTVLSIFVVGIAAVSISQQQEVESAELSQSKAHETLERDRILTIVNNLADAILSTDANGIIRVYNAASLNLLDTNTGLDGRHIDDVLALFDAEDTQVKLLDDMKNTRSVVVRDDMTMTIAEETVRLEVTYSPIRSSYSVSKRADSQDGYILILRDITKAKSLEEERDEFISVVSHELRTPITIAEGTISNVQVMMERPNIAKQTLQDGIATAHDQVIFLAKMVNDLSTLSRAERGVADAEEEIDVKTLVNELFSEYAPQAAKKDLHFNLDIGSHLGSVMASRLYLQ
jgi:signal transduction histidine kinase